MAQHCRTSTGPKPRLCREGVKIIHFIRDVQMGIPSYNMLVPQVSRYGPRIKKSMKNALSASSCARASREPCAGLLQHAICHHSS